MADISTLSPTTLADPQAAPSVPTSSAAHPASSITADDSKPKSALYNDKALTANTPAAQFAATATSPRPLLNPQKINADTPHPSLVHENASQGKESTGDGINMSIDPAVGKLTNTETENPATSSEPSAQTEAQPTSPSPDLSSGPNLYPNVHVTLNPNPITDAGQFTAGQTQTPADSTLPPTLAASSNTLVSEMTAEEEPQPPQQAQNPQSQSPSLSSKHDDPNDSRKAELPNTSTRGEHPSPTVPLIQEPVCALPLHFPNPRPAPDTLSYLESASLMSGTLESLSGLGDDGSSVGSDSEINGSTIRRTDKYGFLGGNQYSESR